MSIAKPWAYYPVIISSTNREIAFTIPPSSNSTAFIATGTYYSPADLATAVQAAFTTAGYGPWTVTYDAVAGRFTIARGGGDFTLQFFTGSNQASLELGFTPSTTAASGGTVTGPNQPKGVWQAPSAVASDSKDIRDRAMDTLTVAVGGQTKLVTEVEHKLRALVFKYLPPEQTFITRQSAPYTAIENLWESGRPRFRYWPDRASGTYADWVLEAETLKKFAPKRMNTGRELYEFELRLRGYVP